MDFDSITPEDIIGSGVRDRDWSVRTDAEKPCGWHFHVAAYGSHYCVTGVPGDTLPEAEGNALDEWVPCFQIATGREDDHLEQIFGNDRCTYCAVPGCGGRCGLPVSVIRLQDKRLTEAGPVAPQVIMFDLELGPRVFGSQQQQREGENSVTDCNVTRLPSAAEKKTHEDWVREFDRERTEYKAAVARSVGAALLQAGMNHVSVTDRSRRPELPDKDGHGTQVIVFNDGLGNSYEWELRLELTST